MLNGLWQNRYMEVRLPNYIGNRCFSEAMRDGYDGLITQTGIVLQGLGGERVATFHAGK